MEFNLIAAPGRIIVEVIDNSEEQLQGGLVLSNSVNSEVKEGIIRSVGKLKEDQKKYEVGQTVIFGKYVGTPYSIDSVDYSILSYDDILAIKTNN